MGLIRVLSAATKGSGHSPAPRDPVDRATAKGGRGRDAIAAVVETDGLRGSVPPSCERHGPGKGTGDEVGPARGSRRGTQRSVSRASLSGNVDGPNPPKASVRGGTEPRRPAGTTPAALATRPRPHDRNPLRISGFMIILSVMPTACAINALLLGLTG